MKEESAIQITLMEWIRLAYPRAIVNSSSHAGLEIGPRLGALAKKLGYLKGFPDIHICEPLGGFHGMFMELKRKEGGEVSPDQREVILALRERGYKTIVARGFDEAVKAIQEYMALKPSPRKRK